MGGREERRGHGRKGGKEGAWEEGEREKGAWEEGGKGKKRVGDNEQLL